MAQHRIRHIFSLADVPRHLDGRPVRETYDFGRFRASLRGRPGTEWLIARSGGATVTVSSDAGALGALHLNWELWHARDGLAQLHVDHVVEVVDDIPELLKVFCHERLSLRFDDVPFVEWLQRSASLAALPTLQTDVLQLVKVDASARGMLGSKESPSPTALGLAYRATSGGDGGLGALRLPSELNREKHEFGIHGRGVIVLCGQGVAKTNALQLVAAELLLANGRARSARATILQQLQRADAAAATAWRDIVLLSELSETVRTQRIALAVGVRSFSDGLFSPEIVLDDFRFNFSSSLRLEETTAATESLLETLSEVLASYVAEARLISAHKSEVQQATWQGIISLTSGIALPFALLLSYFGVSSAVNAPSPVSIFDFHFYWAPWTVAILVSAGVVILSVRRLWRLRRL